MTILKFTRTIKIMDEGKDKLTVITPDADGGPKDSVVPHEEVSPQRQLVREIKAKALAGKTSIEDIAAFEQSTSGAALGVLEDYLQLRELSELVPYFKGKIAGDFSEDLGDADGRGFNLRFPGYSLQVNEEGTIEMTPPMNGMDDSLLYDTEDRYDRSRLGAVIKPKTGRVELHSGEPVNPTSESKFRSMFEITRGYFADVRRAVPAMRNAAQMGLSPDISLPRFPTAQMNQVRAVPALLQ